MTSQDPELTEMCGAMWRGAGELPLICSREPHEGDPRHQGFAPASWYDGGTHLYVVGS